MTKKKRAFALQRGESVHVYADSFMDNRPELLIVGSGDKAYIWVGGDGGPCYATLSGAAVKKFRDALTAALARKS